MYLQGFHYREQNGCLSLVFLFLCVLNWVLRFRGGVYGKSLRLFEWI